MSKEQSVSKLSRLEKDLLLELLDFSRRAEAVDRRSLHSFGTAAVSRGLAELEARGLIVRQRAPSGSLDSGDGGQAVLLPVGRIVAELIEVKEAKKESR